MSKFKLSRRTVIKGAGSIAIALPWLEAMGNNRAKAQATTPLKRFVSVYQPGGVVRSGSEGDKYTPTGTESAFTLSEILKPLEPVKNRLLLVDGTNLTCGDQSMYNVEQHQGGSVGWLTGAIQSGAGGYPKNPCPSIDQVLAPKLSANKAFGSMEIAVRWGTGKSKGKISPINAMFFNTMGPIPPRLEPQEIFTQLFGAITGGGGGGAGGAGGSDPNAVALMRKKSILDFVDKKYVALGAKLGTTDKVKLEAHLTQIRELEKRIMVMPPSQPGATCQKPAQVDTTGYNAKSGLNSNDTGSVVDSKTDMMIPTVGKFMMDMMVMALACDRTGVISLQWSDTEAKHTFPWLQLNQHHHYYQHDGGFNAPACVKICTWYAEQHAYLLQEMQKRDMGGHTLLDESLVFFGSELSHPPTHAKNNMGFILAGGDGKTPKTGRWIKGGNVPHNRLLTSILNLYGDNRTTFGDAKIASSPLTTPGLV